MVLAYVLSTYPRPSLTFIRREIAALEARGLTVHRFAMRRSDEELVDEADRAEQRRIGYILEVGTWGLVTALVGDALTRPRRWAGALAKALKLGFESRRGLVRHLIYLAEACVLRRRLEECNARHMHAHFGTNPAAVALLCRLLGGPPYSITIHGPEEFDASWQSGLRDKVHHAAFVVAISQFTRSQVFRWCNTEDWPRVHMIHCGVSEDFLSAASVPVPERPRLAIVARLNEQKGHLLLIEAANRLRDLGIDFELVIIGDGPMRGEIQGLIDRYDLREQVRITGNLSNHGVRQGLQAARALVLPSFAEGLPVVAMEALALGRPVITTYIAGIPELVDQGVNGWLVPAGAVEPLVEAMVEALTADPSELDVMGFEGAARVAEQHNIDIQAAKLVDLFTTRVSRTIRPGQDQHATQAEAAFPGRGHRSIETKDDDPTLSHPAGPT
jgi:colanic acid/amylovoran biosynthesis glycosyltransferase